MTRGAGLVCASRALNVRPAGLVLSTPYWELISIEGEWRAVSQVKSGKRRTNRKPAEGVALVT